MEFYLTEIAKYVIAGCLLAYTFFSFLVFMYKGEKRRGWIYTIQTAFLFLTQFACFIQIIAKTGSKKYLLLLAIQMVVLITTISLYRIIYPDGNRLIINNLCFMLMVGMLVITRISYWKGIKQFAIACVSLILAFLIPELIFRLEVIEKWGFVFAGIGLVILLILLVAGSVANGSKINFRIAGISFMPSELVKIIFVFFAASVLSKSQDFKTVALATAAAAAHVIILVFLKDLGSALIYFMVYMCILLVATKNPFYFISGIGLGAVASVVAYRLFPHIQTRVEAFVDPWTKIDNAGYQITQSLFAISGGGFFGLGLYGGNPSSIPYVEEDFIFAAIAEELGILFACGLVAICVSTFIMILLEAYKIRNGFGKLMCVGFAVTYIFQVFLTVGGNSKFIPLTGVTLPLVSYGGTSILVTIIMFALIEGECLVRSDERYQDYVNKKKGLAENIPEKEKSPSIVFIGILNTVMYIAMISYIVIYAVSNKVEMIDNGYNTHQQLLKKQNIRGTIYSADGKELAKTVTDEKGEESREYPYANEFAHIIGFSTNGKSGIESMANYYLINSNESLSNKAAAYSNEEKFNGDNVYTTLNTSIQETAYEALSAHKGAIIVSEVKTGKVLAMVSKPDFDPNEIQKIWADITNDEDNTQLLNRVTQGIYPPGSTFKIVTALEYYRQNGDAYKDYRFSCNGKFTYGDETINCYHGENHGSLDFATSFAKSCNSSFANIAIGLDKESFSKTLKDLLFKKDLPWDMSYSTSVAYCAPDLSDGDTMQLGIGQGTTTVTPLHMNLITNAIANDGVLMKPQILDRVVSADGKVVESFKTEQYKRLMTADEAEFLTGIMEGVVQKGTATKLKGLSYTAAGKTGSAEFKDSTSDSHAWFTGFAPLENPEISVTIIVENAGSGGEYAVPIAKRIFDDYFDVD